MNVRDRGYVKLSDMLKLKGLASACNTTIQNILIKHGMATRYERILNLQEKVAVEPITLIVEQIALIEKANP